MDVLAVKAGGSGRLDGLGVARIDTDPVGLEPGWVDAEVTPARGRDRTNAAAVAETRTRRRRPHVRNDIGDWTTRVGWI